MTRLRERADTMAASAAAMKKIADAADPLYKTLDEGQKRRLAVLTRMDGRFGGGWRHRGWDRDDGGRAQAAALSAIASIATARPGKGGGERL